MNLLGSLLHTDPRCEWRSGSALPLPSSHQSNQTDLPPRGPTGLSSYNTVLTDSHRNRVEVAIRALGHRHQLQLLNSPDLQPRPLARAGELLVVQPLGHDSGTRCSGEWTRGLADLGVGLNPDRLDGPRSQRFYRVCSAGRRGMGRGPQTGGAKCPDRSY